MDINKIVGIMYSGVRSGEKEQVLGLLSSCGLEQKDISQKKLGHFLVARRGDEILGVAGLEISGSDALLRSLAVAESFRRQGIGRSLVDTIERHALSMGVETLYLLTLTAETFFSRRGYRPADRSSVPAGIRDTEEFRSLSPGTAACMHKRISQPVTT